MLEQTLGFLTSKEDSEQKLKALKQQLNEAPKQTAENQRELARLKESKVVRYGGLDVPQLEQLLSQRSTQQSDLQKELNDANSLTITAQTRPERAQAEISANQTRIQQINNILKSGKDNGKTLNADQRNLLNAELASINALNLPPGAGRQQPVAGPGREPA